MKGLMESWHNSCCYLKHKVESCTEIMHISPLRFLLFLWQGKKSLSKQVLCTILHSLLSYASGNPIMGLSSDQRSVLVLPSGCMCCSSAEYQDTILTSTSLGVLSSTELGCPHQLLHVKRLNTAQLDEMG